MRLEVLSMALTLQNGEVGLDVSSKLPNGEKSEEIHEKIKELSELISDLLIDDLYSFLRAKQKNDILDQLKELLQ